MSSTTKTLLSFLAMAVLASCATESSRLHRHSPQINNRAPLAGSSLDGDFLSILDEFLQKQSLKTIKDIVRNSVDENTRNDIQRSFEYMPFPVFRHAVMFSIPLFNREEYDNILIDFYYGKNNKGDRTPKELFLDAYKKGAMSFRGRDIEGARVQSRDLDKDNKYGKTIVETFYKDRTGVIFTNLILFKISKKNGREFWLPYDMKNIATADIQQHSIFNVPSASE